MSKDTYTPTGKYHVVVLQRVGDVIGTVIPALYISLSGRPKLVSPLVEYFLKHSDKSITWKRQTSKALGLFYDYWTALNEVETTKRSHSEIMRRFGLALAIGTIDPDTSTDRLNLFWPSISISNTKRLITSLQNFTAWCIDEGYSATSSFPNSSNSSVEMIESNWWSFLPQALKIKSFSFLAHSLQTNSLAKSLSAKKHREVVSLEAIKPSNNSEAKIFPSWLVPELMSQGFILDNNAEIPWEREDLTAKLITILLLFGGARKSEPFHLWFNDVIPQLDGTCKVFFRHPSESETHLPGEKKLTRRNYLAALGLYPRNSDSASKSFRAGWKNLAVDESYSAPVFFLHPAAENLFRSIFLVYLRYREKLLSIHTAKGNPVHPFLFVSKSKGFEGSPYSISSYEKALKRAYKRIEKIKGVRINWGKYHGTTPHGMRHFYGQTLQDVRFDQKMIQKCMRHKSVLSQAVYTEPKNKNIQESLQAAADKLEAGDSQTLTIAAIEAIYPHA